MLEQVLEILSKAVVKDIVVYNMSDFSPFYDYFVVGSVNSNRQGAAAINYLKKDISLVGGNVKSFSSSNESGWFLIDLGDVVVHIFVGDERYIYNLDAMYSHLPKQFIED